jgi:site-specific recombinase XerC
MADRSTPTVCQHRAAHIDPLDHRVTHDLRLVQEMLGHSSPVTTSGYAAWSPTEAATAIEGLTYGAIGR